MTDSRSRFEAWWTRRLLEQGWGADSARLVFHPSTIDGLTYSSAPTENAWIGWQAAEAETARRCYEIVRSFPATREGMLVVIQDEFPEVFK